MDTLLFLTGIYRIKVLVKVPKNVGLVLLDIK